MKLYWALCTLRFSPNIPFPVKMWSPYCLPENKLWFTAATFIWSHSSNRTSYVRVGLKVKNRVYSLLAIPLSFVILLKKAVLSLLRLLRKSQLHYSYNLFLLFLKSFLFFQIILIWFIFFPFRQNLSSSDFRSLAVFPKPFLELTGAVQRGSVVSTVILMGFYSSSLTALLLNLALHFSMGQLKILNGSLMHNWQSPSFMQQELGPNCDFYSLYCVGKKFSGVVYISVTKRRSPWVAWVNLSCRNVPPRQLRDSTSAVPGSTFHKIAFPIPSEVGGYHCLL